MYNVHIKFRNFMYLQNLSFLFSLIDWKAAVSKRLKVLKNNVYIFC